MRRLLHVVLAWPMLFVAAAALPSVVQATPCNWPTSTTPTCISLVGSNGVAPAQSFGLFQVIVRDIASNPLAGAAIVIDLSGAPDLVLCADQLDPGVVVDCVHKTVTRISDASGSAVFTLLGGSVGPAVSLLGAGHIFADGCLIQSPTVSAYDLDGSGGVGANDLSAWLGDFGSGTPYGRDDYDCSGNVGANDLSLWLAAFGSGAMVQSCSSQCP